MAQLGWHLLGDIMIDLIEALIFLLGAAATIAAVLLSGVRLSAAEKRKFTFLDRIQRKQGRVLIFFLASIFLSIALFFVRQALQQRHSGAAAALERYLAIESVLTDLEQEVAEEPLTPSSKARQLASKLPDRGAPYVRALKAAVEGRYADAREVLAESDVDAAYKEFRLRAQIETFAGQFSQAAFWYRKALREPEVDLEILGEYSLALHRAGRYTDARTLAEATQALQATVFGPNDMRLFLGRLALSNILQDLGLYSTALEELGPACENLIKYLGSDPHQEALCRMRRGDLLLELGRYEQAESELDRALEGLGPEGDDAPIERAEIHRLRGILYHDWGHYEESEMEYERSLGLLRDAVGVNHPYVALILNNMGDLRLDKAQYDKANKLYREASRIQAAGGFGNRQFEFTTQHNMARLVEAQGNLQEAEKAYLKALRIGYLVYPGKKHRNIGVLLGNLAILCDRLGQIERAENYHRQAISMRSETLGAQHPLVANAYNNFGSHLARRGRLEEAEGYIRRSISIDRLAFGPIHPDVARSLNTLGMLYLKWKKEKEAEVIFEESLRIRRSVYGLMHPDTAVSLNNLARCKSALGKMQEADSLFSEAVKVSEHFIVSQGNVSLLPILDYYAQFLDTYSPGKAVERHKLNAAVRKGIPGP